VRILLVGGTGTAGRVVAARAAEAGHHVRVLSRHAPERPTPAVERVVGDLITGAGLDAAMAGVEAVVDLSNPDRAAQAAATAFFVAATDNLVAAEQRAGVGHHVVLSIVGVDRYPTGYYRAKLAQEAAAAGAAARPGLGHTIARVTQFHDFVTLIVQRSRLGPLVLAPRLHLQPVHLRDVADHLLGLLEAPPAGRAPDLGGPQAEELPDMLRRYLAAAATPLRVLPVPLVGPTRRPNEARVLRPATGVHGTLTFDDWLREATR
jgi:uncharacterized protein YbjT (DUF2867 family)